MKRLLLPLLLCGAAACDTTIAPPDPVAPKGPGAPTGPITISRAPYRVFEVTFLGCPAEKCETADFNNAAQVVGFARSTGGEPRAVLWQEGRWYDLGDPPGGKGGQARAINEQGKIVGSTDSVGVWVWEAGRMTVLPWCTLRPNDLNEAGVIVGDVQARKPEYLYPLAHRCKDGIMARYPYTSTWKPAFEGSTVWSINNKGEAAGGHSPQIGSYWSSAMWKDDLGGVHLGNGSGGAIINDSSEIIISVDVRSTPALRRKDGRWARIDAPLGAEARIADLNDLNNASQVLGTLHSKDKYPPEVRPFLWEDSVSYEIVPEGGWVITSASKINDRGQILGIGTHAASGRKGPVLLTPKKSR